MIFDMQYFNNLYSNYKNINQKISLEEKKGNIYRIRRGLYSNDISRDKLVLANMCYSPSYISFEYALSYYGLIPERVSVVTSAAFNKNHNKKYISDKLILEYRHIPNNVFIYGISIIKGENGINYKIATKEKALCDELYSKYSVRSIKDLKMMLYEDLRIDEEDIMALDLNELKELALQYHSNTLNILAGYILEELL